MHVLDEKRKLHWHCKPIHYVINDNGCWVCINHQLDKDGYPRFVRDKKKVVMSRYVYELYIEPIKEGNHILHSCDNPSCINPDHLSQGTNQDNMTDRNNKKRQAYGERNGNVKLSIEQVKEIKRLAVSRELSQTKIAKQFGVSRSLVQKILYGDLWSELNE